MVCSHGAGAQGALATIISEPTNQPYGQREYRVRNPEGHSWWIAAPLDR